MPNRDREFVFIAGTSGSGTTLLLRMLSSLPEIISLGGNHVDVGDSEVGRRFVERIDEASRIYWDSRSSFAEWQSARDSMQLTIEEARTTTEFPELETILFKRSCPFYREEFHRPSFLDATNELGADKIIWIQRNLVDTTYSSFRREFCKNLRHTATTQVVCFQQLQSEFKAIDPNKRMFIAYEDLCQQPLEVAMRLTSFLGCDLSGLKHWINENPMKLKRKILTEATEAQRRFVESFWNARGYLHHGSQTVQESRLKSIARSIPGARRAA